MHIKATKAFWIEILWGEDSDTDNGPKIYGFDTAAELHAFLTGASEAIGWSSHETLDLSKPARASIENSPHLHELEVNGLA